MSGLQIVLLVNMLLIGVLAAVASRHALAHYWPSEHDREKSKPKQDMHLPPAIRQKLLEEAQADFHLMLRRSVKELEKDLQDTTAKIHVTLEKEGNETIAHQIKLYRDRLAQLQQQTEENISSIGQDLSSHQNTLKAKLAEEVEAEKKRLLQQIDTKLADAVGSFLTETLQHNIDLGAQSEYLKKMLEEHKAEIAKEIANEN
jgi:phosphoglycerate-specific signal transduction histidine kinase